MKATLLRKKFDFEPGTTAYNWKNAHGCAMASYIAYAKQSEIRKYVEDNWKGDFEFITKNGTQAFVMGMEEMVLVAFRGTEPKHIEDWITDLDLKLVPGPMRGEVHDGFYKALRDVWPRIKLIIDRFRQDKAKSLWFTGHSLGAGLATLAVATLRHDDLPVDGLYTFGQPRTGNSEFADHFKRDFDRFSFRFVNNNDVVTRVPPRSLGYRHVGTFRYFDEGGQFHEEIGKWNRLLDRARGRLQDLFELGTDGIKDHSMEEYLPRVTKQYDKAFPKRKEAKPKRK